MTRGLVPAAARRSPLRGGVCTVERVLEFDDVSVLLLQLPVMLHVILDQLRQRGELLPAVQVVEVARVLDLDVGDGAISPEERRSAEGFSLYPQMAPPAEPKASKGAAESRTPAGQQLEQNAENLNLLPGGFLSVTTQTF